MLQKTHLGISVEKTNYEAEYDANAKELLSDKQVLAWIMKYCVSEFQDYNMDDIIASIEGTPEVSTVSLHPGKSGPDRITGMNTESSIINEGKVTFDIRFYAVTRDEKRIFFKNEKYDLLSVIMVRLSRKEDTEGGNELHKMLSTLFSNKLDIKTKKDRLENWYHMKMTEKIEGGISAMCNLSEAIRDEGIEKGINETKLNNARSLLDLLDENTIAERIGLPLETVQKLKKESVN